MEKSEITCRIKSIIVEILELPIKAEEISDNELIWGDGGIDSVDTLNVLLAIEGEFGVSFETEMFNPAVLETVNGMSSFISEALEFREQDTDINYK